MCSKSSLGCRDWAHSCRFLSLLDADIVANAVAKAMDASSVAGVAMHGMV